MKYELKSLSYGETIGTAFNIYLDNFIPLMLISLITSLPFYINNFIGLNEQRNQSTQLLYSILFLAISIIMSAIQSGLTIKIVSQRYLGKESDLSQNWDDIKKILKNIINVSFRYFFYMIGGFILLIIPGIIIALRYCLAVNVLVIESCTPKDAMARSKELTKNKLGMIFLYLIIPYIIILGINLSSQYVSNSIVIFFQSQNQWIKFIFTSVVSSLTAPFLSCIMVLIYFNFRIEKEGFNIEHLTSSFLSEDGEGVIE